MEKFKFISFLLNRFVPRFLRFSVLCHLIFFHSLVFGQDFTIRQGIDGSTNQPERQLQGQLLQTADGYTPITGVTPTITIRPPGATSFVAAANAGVDVGKGNYTFAVGPTEWQTLGYGAFEIAGTGARPKLYTYRVIEEGSTIRDGATFVKYPYTLGSPWLASGVTVTADNAATYGGFSIADTLTGDGANAVHRVTLQHTKPEGSGYYYFTTEVKSGTLNNAWVGDYGWGAGIDINTSTGAVTSGATTALLGWKVDKLGSSWWRVHLLLGTNPTDSTVLTSTLGLGNGTAVATTPTFATSGTMLFANTKYARAEDVSPLLIETLLPNLQSAASTSNVTLASSDVGSSSVFINREICFSLGYASNIGAKAIVYCSCVATYDGTTKVATLDPSLPTTLANTYKYKIGGLCLKNVNVSSMSTDSISAAAVSAAAAAKIGATVPTNINMGG